ncbi:MAG: glutamate--tRNA ligase [Planctomycetes bacterium]|nr:glutamate--tRNA ligase [Planctomycetota bacterium]
MSARPPVVRIAPSPTGDPHVGTAYIALFNLCVARKGGGRFILRIEDTDRTRYDASSEAKIFEALRWLGLRYDEGPDVGGPNGPYRQSERTPLYREMTETLLAKGAAYRCFCTEERLEELRATQRAMKLPPGYDGFCRHLTPDEVRAKVAAGVPHVVRMSVPKEGSTTFHDDLRGDVTFENKTIDDQVLLKSDGFPTYHLANVVDDHAMGVTWVIRAEEWITSTPKHVLLYRAFGWEAPRWTHMPLLRNADRSKISKRKNPTSLIWYRDQGFLPEGLLNFLGLMGYGHPEGKEKFTFDELVATFDIGRLSTTGPVFDLEKLKWLNGEWIRSLTDDDLAARVVAHVERRAQAPTPEDAANPVMRRVLATGADDAFRALVRRTTPLVRERIRTLEEYASIAACFFHDTLPTYPAEDLVAKKRTPAETRDALARVRAALDAAPSWRAAELEAALRALAEATGWKPGDLFTPVRTAVTGAKVSPPLFETMEILGRATTLARLDAALPRLG